jgi:hypothetical protein
MKKLIRKIIENDDIFCMANLNKDEFPNLPVNIWVQPDDGKSKHGPRIKVQNNTSSNRQPSDTISISISKTPEIKAGKSKLDSKIINWLFKLISDNEDLFMNHYKGQISDRKFLNDMYDILSNM